MSNDQFAANDQFEEDVLDLDGIDSDDDLRGYDYPKEGNYHLVVSSVDEGREKINGLKVEFQVLAGDRPTEIGKTFFENFWDPSPESKDGGKFAKKRRAVLARATWLLTPDQLKGAAASIRWQRMLGRQIVARVTNYERKTDDGKTFSGAQIDGLKIYAVGDPAVADVPKNPDAIDAMQRALGRTAPAATPAPAQPAAQQPLPQQPAPPTTTGGKWDSVL